MRRSVLGSLCQSLVALRRLYVTSDTEHHHWLRWLCSHRPKPPKLPTLNFESSSANPKLLNPISRSGTWQYNDSVAEQVVVDALDAGFSHIDTAYDYGNQVGSLGFRLQRLRL